MQVEPFSQKVCPRCDREPEAIVGDELYPDDRLFCVIHGQVGLGAEMVGASDEVTGQRTR